MTVNISILRIYSIFGVVFAGVIAYSSWQALAQAIQAVSDRVPESIAKPPGDRSESGHCAG